MSQSTTTQLRAEVENLLGQARWAEAHARLGDLWRREPKSSTASYIVACYDRAKAHLSFTKSRLFFLRSLTVEPLVPMLRAAALVAGIDLDIHVGQFNSYPQEILDSKSALYASDPKIAVLAVQTRDIAPELWESFADLSPADVCASINRVRDAYADWIRAFRKNSQASLIIHLLAKPLATQGVLDAQSPNGQLTAIEQINAELRKICAEHRGVYALDYDALVARNGRARWHDEGKWLMMRMPFAADSLLPMVSEWLRFIHPLMGAVCKVLAVDLDNTLWGGILGEDGIDGIKLGLEHPGATYRAIQRAILDIHQRGVLLAVCSKNNRDEGMAALQNHPEMILRPEHFAAFRINWQDKAQNIREIAAELNLGIDSIAFLDDNPVERERVRTDIPEVKVIALPDQPQGFAAALRDCPYFERLTLSAEDREHTRMYHEQQKRTELATSVTSLEDFYRSLDQEVVITPVAADSIQRVAQLTQKTNQFNITTRRYTEQQIEEMAAQPGCGVYGVRVKDRFGDNGLVGVMITKSNGEVCEIDTMLLSCRVIGRTVETAMLGFLSDVSKSAGVRELQGWFIPTKKNAPVRELFPSHGFAQIRSENEATLWSLNLSEAAIPCPEWIRLHVTNTPNHAEQARA
jgi:FkbH-like protein